MERVSVSDERPVARSPASVDEHPLFLDTRAGLPSGFRTSDAIQTAATLDASSEDEDEDEDDEADEGSSGGDDENIEDESGEDRKTGSGVPRGEAGHPEDGDDEKSDLQAPRGRRSARLQGFVVRDVNGNAPLVPLMGMARLRRAAVGLTNVRAARRERARHRRVRQRERGGPLSHAPNAARLTSASQVVAMAMDADLGFSDEEGSRPTPARPLRRSPRRRGSSDAVDRELSLLMRLWRPGSD